ncbi:MAG: NCS2 family permease [Clostridiaceae bacterium]
MENFFKLKENKTDVKTEFFAGLTTFLTMAYILFVNPNILSATGMNKNAVFIATVIAAVIGTLVMGLFANVPFAQAPGMGLNAFFTYTVVFGMGFTWQQALGMVFICGLINILITATKIRKEIIKAIPESMQYAISGGIGLFITYIGLMNAGFLKFLGDGEVQADGTFHKIVPSMVDFTSISSLVALAGLLITIVLMLRKVKAAILIGIIATTILAIVTGVVPPEHLQNLGAGSGVSLTELGDTFLKLDILGLFADPGKLLLVFSTIFAFSLTDTFDTIGTFLGAGRKSGIFDDKDAEMFEKSEGGFNSKLERALFADATATSIGAIFGTSNTTTYVESAAGISVGGKTGLTSVVTALLFVLSLVLLPIIGIVPAVATAPALIVVGILMVESIGNIDWSDLEVAVPAFFTMAMMPLAYSITAGVSTGFIFYCLTKVVVGKAKEVSTMMYIFTGLFILSMILTAVV